MTDNEYIKLNRKIIGWEWYLNINVKTLFIHCLLKANWKDGRFEGKYIKRGSFVTSLEKLKVETGLSVQQIRTALEKLQSTGEVTSKTFSKYRIITVVNYEQYQNDNRVCNNQDNKQFNKQITSNQQASNKQVTTIEEKKEKKEREELKNNNIPPLSPQGEKPEEKPKKKSLSPKEAQIEINKMIDDSGLSTEVKDKLKEFVEYRRTIRKPPLVSPKLFTEKIEEAMKCEKEYGSYATVKCIDDCLGNGYQGVFYNRAWQYAKEKPKQASSDKEEMKQEILRLMGG